MDVMRALRGQKRLTQFIKGDGKLNEKDLDKYVKEVKLEKAGLDYAVVSIIGPQSSGKSTLMNNLFGTTFQTMDAEKGVTQTTLGIWIARASDIEPCTIVIDVEGSDGVERGEDGTLFEKQSALFALAVSDVVLVNMWCRDIRRVHGGSVPLLKIVFEKIMGLKSRKKTTLLFVLRDKSSMTPFARLEADLTENIEKLFDSVSKPEDHKNSSLSTFFNVEVTSLSNFEYRSNDFKEEVKTLRERFINSTSLGGLAGDKTDKVPSSEFSYSIKTLWQSIKENKDLDLPAHKIMVDTVRCDDIVEKSYSNFEVNKDWQNLEKSVKSGPVVGFGGQLSKIINTCLSQYDASVIHCDEKVRSIKRQILLLKLLKRVQKTSDSMLEYVYSTAADAFKQALDTVDLSPGNILGSITRCRELAMSVFAEECKDIEIEHVELDVSKVRDRVEIDIEQYVELTTLRIDKKNAVAKVAATNAAAAEEAAIAKVMADAVAAAQAAILDASDAKSKYELEFLAEKAKMEEKIAVAKAATAASEAKAALMAAELADILEKEMERKMAKRKCFG